MSCESYSSSVEGILWPTVKSDMLFPSSLLLFFYWTAVFSSNKLIFSPDFCDVSYHQKSLHFIVMHALFYFNSSCFVLFCFAEVIH